jgi:hypothetical protein
MLDHAECAMAPSMRTLREPVQHFGACAIVVAGIVAGFRKQVCDRLHDGNALQATPQAGRGSRQGVVGCVNRVKVVRIHMFGIRN